MHVLVLNQYAGNKGDRAVLYFVVRELIRNGVECVSVSTHDPSLWGNEFPYPAEFIPWGWNTTRSAKPGLGGRVFRRLKAELAPWVFNRTRNALLRSPRRRWPRWAAEGAFGRCLTQADLVVSTGGHHVTSLLSPDARTPQLRDMALALLAEKPLVLWSQTIGPLDFSHRVNRDFVRRLLLETEAIWLRDIQSWVELEKLEVGTDHVHQTCESVFGLNDLLGAYSVPSRRPPVLGISVYATQRRTAAAHEHYVHSLAAVTDHAVRQGYEIRFFPMELENVGVDDRPLIREIMGCMAHTERCLVDGDLDTRDHLAAVARCRMFLGHKTHSVVFALTAGTPLLALAYHRKTVDLMAGHGLEEFCLEDAALSPQRLIDRFEAVQPRLDSLGQRIFARSRELGATVRADFATMVETANRSVGNG